MSRLLLSCILSVLVATSVRGFGVMDVLPLGNELDDEDLENEIEEEEERLIIIPAITLNITSLASALPLAIAAAASAVALIGTITLGIILISLLVKLKYDDGYGYGYGGSGYGTTSGGYNSYRSIFDPFIVDWEKFSIMDLIKIAQETWETYEPTNEECQKRLICEIHRNSHKLGFAAEKIVDLFEYLYYTKVFRMPEELGAFIDPYLQAAEKGQSLEKECGEFFPDCKFSITEVVDEFNSVHTNTNHV